MRAIGRETRLTRLADSLFLEELKHLPTTLLFERVHLRQPPRMSTRGHREYRWFRRSSQFSLGARLPLRVYSNSLRIERQRWAKAQAIRGAITLAPVLVLFVVSFVTLGLAVIQLVRSLGPR